LLFVLGNELVGFLFGEFVLGNFFFQGGNFFFIFADAGPNPALLPANRPEPAVFRLTLNLNAGVQGGR
jgi:hypothetical protein